MHECLHAGNQIGLEGGAALAAALGARPLASLDLGMCGLGDAPVALIAEGAAVGAERPLDILFLKLRGFNFLLCARVAPTSKF